MKKLFFWFLVVTFTCAFWYMLTRPVKEYDGYPVVDCNKGAVVTHQDFKDEILDANIIYVLESHGRKSDHDLQKEILEDTLRFNPDTVLANEHLRKNAYDHQKIMDLYAQGEITYNELKKNIPLLRMYPAMEPLFQLIGERGIKTIALNIPIPFSHERLEPDTVTIKSLRKKLLTGETPEKGYYNLSEKEKKFLPKDGFQTLVTAKAYNYIFGSFGSGDHGMGGVGKIFVGFCVMNETMAQSILDFYDDPKNKNVQMVVCAGSNHGIFNEGIRRSVAERRSDLKQVTIYTISEDEFILRTRGKDIELSHESAIETIKKEKFADYVIFYKQDPKTTNNFVKEVNDMVLEIGDSIGLKLKHEVNCKIIGPFEAYKIMGNSYNSSIKGLYIDNTLYFIEREDKKVTAEGRKELIDHEGVHALQDQYFDLKRLHKIQEESSADKSAAIQALIEGHAVWAMIHNNPDSHVSRMLHQSFISKRTGRLVPPDTILKYRCGGNFVKYLFEKGGRDLVNSTFERLPESSEQIMHPEKYLAEERPLTVGELGAPYGHEFVDAIVHGEIGVLYDLFEGGVSEEEALKSSEGWAADKMFLYREEKTGNKATYWATFWDTEADAREYAESYIGLTTGNWEAEPMISFDKEDKSYTYSWDRWDTGGIRRDVTVYADNKNVNIIQKIKTVRSPQNPHGGGHPMK